MNRFGYQGRYSYVCNMFFLSSANKMLLHPPLPPLPCAWPRHAIALTCEQGQQGSISLAMSTYM